MTAQLEELLDFIIDFVKRYSASSIEPVVSRLSALESKAPITGERGEAGPAGKDGRDGMPGAAGAQGPTGERGEKGADGIAGRDGAPGERGEKGADGIAGRDGAPGERGEKGADGRDGKDADPDHVKLLVDRTLELMLPELVLRAVEGATPDIVARAAALIPVPANGRDGRDGAAGAPGARGEKGLDGSHGRDGVDGFALDDIDIALDGRTLTLSLSTGQRVVKRAVKLVALPDYKGIYQRGQAHEAGDMVTYGGSMWLAKRETNDPPPGDAWQLVVKGGK